MNNTYYNEKLETLPENLQYAVIMSNWKESLVQIQTQFKLHIDQTQVLEDSAIKLMFGDIDAPDFINHMFNDAHINSETAADILLEVDLKILKKIREILEGLRITDEEEEEIEDFLMDNEERKAREEDDAYANHYAEIAKIREEDDMSPEDEVEQVPEVKAIPEIQEVKKIEVEPVKSAEEIHVEMLKEKDELLNEINSPTKSFILESSRIQTIPVDHQIENTHLEEPFHPYKLTNELPKTEVRPQQPIQPRQEYNPIPADHQLENTHLEKPFHPYKITNELPKTEVTQQQQQQQQPIQPRQEYNPIPADHQLENTHLEKPFHPYEPTPVKISTTLNKKPEIKKPITINLDDIYREPLQ
jgi:uncharacterized protein (DUF2267 family)